MQALRLHVTIPHGVHGAHQSAASTTKIPWGLVLAQRKLDFDLGETIEIAFLGHSSQTLVDKTADPRHAPMTVFECGDQVHANLKWTSRNISTELAAEGVEGIQYRLQRPLGERFFDLCAEPVGIQDKERLTFLRMDVRDHREEMILCPADHPLRKTELAPLSGTEGELVQRERDRSTLENLSRLQEQFARQVLLDLGMAWPVPAPCLHCR